MTWNEEKHRAMRLWAALPEQSYKDPEELLLRSKGTNHVQYRNKSCMKAYKRIEKLYDEFVKEKALNNTQGIVERAKNGRQ